jgi:flagellar assembly protein FliH
LITTAVFPELVRRAAPAPTSDADARAHALIERAERQAQSLMEAARQKAASLLEAGHREGVLEGRAEALVESRQGVQELIHSLAAARDRLEGLEAEVLGRAEELVVSVALAVAERILQAEIAHDPAAAVRLAKAAVALLPRPGEIVIRVHPEGAALMQAHRDEIGDGASEHGTVRVVADPTLAPGDCLVETPQSVVDATFPVQLEEARRRLLELPW